MNKNALITVIVILIAIVGIIGVLSYSNSTPASTEESQTAGPVVDTSQATPTPPISGSDADTSGSDASSTDNASVEPGPVTYQVSYSDSGFSPQTLTLRAGDSVTWTNNSSGRMWVASDPHPTHTELPGFDEKSASQSGGSWTYIFTVTGSHGYHNHANPQMRGTVVVQ